MPPWNLSRRELIRLFSGGTLASAAGLACSRPGPVPPTAAVPDFTVAFLTDPHIYEQKSAPLGTTRAFAHAMAQPRRPDLVITGGDLAFDLLAVGRENADAQLDLLTKSLAQVTVPIHHTLGNHDVYGLYPQSGVAPSDPLYGKQYFLKRLGLERTYRSFDHAGWHFVILDTIGIEGNTYRGWVDEEQLVWLERDLAAAAKPTVVVGHIPLFSNYIEWQRGTSAGIPDVLSVVNCHQVAKVLVQYPVKLVLAGHLHVNEVFRYKGIEFVNVGAVSGNWWDGPRDGFEEGYAVLEFRGDQVSWRYVDYGWDAVPPPPAPQPA